jgi:hypothetical protein
MTTLQDLLARVEAAEGPDREIDAAIYNAMVDDGGRKAFRVTDWTRGRAPMLGRYHDGWLTGKSDSDIYADDLVRFTASIDAALALVERALPDSYVELSGPRKYLHIPTPVPNRWCASIVEPGYRGGWGATPPLAILAALLKAKIAQEAPAS